MTPAVASTRDELLEAIFSDDPAPDVQAAVIVSHAGDECLGASWLLSRLYDRASVFRLTGPKRNPAPDAITLTGLPAEHCHELGLESGTLAHDLETLTWLVSAAVKAVEPRLLITHAIEGTNLDHDATALAVQLTALLLPRFGGDAPLVLEFQCVHDGPEPVHGTRRRPDWEQGVRVDFGADSRRLKAQILKSHFGPTDIIHRDLLRSETYRAMRPHDVDIARRTELFARRYHDAPSLSVGELRTNASRVARRFADSGLIAAPAISFF
ncbi:MAG TPA: hypothetical protein VEK56_02795 [Vicinamibacterales bacterium]|nr:hypothetical protein [Vicinamibacterales bacterium]